MCKLHLLPFLVAAGYLTSACSKTEAATASATDPPPGVRPATLSVTSSSFSPNGPMAAKFTCEGDNISPALAWANAPLATKSFAVIVDDPDAPDPAAPTKTFVHFIVYGLPPTTDKLEEGANNAAAAGPGARDGKNDFGQTGWKGPCPPKGRHRYFHKVYALDTDLPDLKQPTKAVLEKAMNGHVVAKGEVVGTYEKQAK